MKISDYQFEKICAIDPQREPLTGSMIVIYPQSAYKNTKNIPLNKYGKGPYCKFKISNSRKSCGVYAITVDASPVYIGECINLSKRYNMGYGNISPRNCFRWGQETNCRINNLIYDAALLGKRIELWFYPTLDYKMVEQNLRNFLKPDWNKV